MGFRFSPGDLDVSGGSYLVDYLGHWQLVHIWIRLFLQIFIHETERENTIQHSVSIYLENVAVQSQEQVEPQTARPPQLPTMHFFFEQQQSNRASSWWLFPSVKEYKPCFVLLLCLFLRHHLNPPKNTLENGFFRTVSNNTTSSKRRCTYRYLALLLMGCTLTLKCKSSDLSRPWAAARWNIIKWCG